MSFYFIAQIYLNMKLTDWQQTGTVIIILRKSLIKCYQKAENASLAVTIKKKNAESGGNSCKSGQKT